MKETAILYLCIFPLNLHVFILQISGKNIYWQHLTNLYEAKEAPGQGLHLLHKLKFDHVYLTSFSRMRVNLAAQVRYKLCIYNYTRYDTRFISSIIKCYA